MKEKVTRLNVNSKMFYYRRRVIKDTIRGWGAFLHLILEQQKYVENINLQDIKCNSSLLEWVNYNFFYQAILGNNMTLQLKLSFLDFLKGKPLCCALRQTNWNSSGQIQSWCHTQINLIPEQQTKNTTNTTVKNLVLTNATVVREKILL